MRAGCDALGHRLGLRRDGLCVLRGKNDTMRVIYLLERIKDSYDWPKGARIWADQPCAGWRVVGTMRVKS